MNRRRFLKWAEARDLGKRIAEVTVKRGSSN